MDTNLSLLPDSEKNALSIQKEQEEALDRLLTGEVPEEVIFDKPGRGGRTQRYVPGWWFLREMNSIFHHLWSQEVREYKIDKEMGQVVALVRVSVIMPGKTVTETFPDGRKIETRYDEMKVIKDQFGGSDIKKYDKGPNSGKVIDLADDCKSAATDGMKKCMTLYGLGRKVYEPREIIDEFAGMTEEEIRLRPLTLRTEKLGWDFEKTKKWFEDNSSKPLMKCQEVDIKMLIPKLPKV